MECLGERGECCTCISCQVEGRESDAGCTCHRVIFIFPPFIILFFYHTPSLQIHHYYLETWAHCHHFPAPVAFTQQRVELFLQLADPFYFCNKIYYSNIIICVLLCTPFHDVIYYSSTLLPINIIILYFNAIYISNYYPVVYYCYSLTYKSLFPAISVHASAANSFTGRMQWMCFARSFRKKKL